MFKLIKKSMYLKIVDVISDSKLYMINVSDYINGSNNKFSYVNDKMISKSFNSKFKKRRYSKSRV